MYCLPDRCCLCRHYRVAQCLAISCLCFVPDFIIDYKNSVIVDFFLRRRCMPTPPVEELRRREALYRNDAILVRQLFPLSKEDKKKAETVISVLYLSKRTEQLI